MEEKTTYNKKEKPAGENVLKMEDKWGVFDLTANTRLVHSCDNIQQAIDYITTSIKTQGIYVPLPYRHI